MYLFDEGQILHRGIRMYLENRSLIAPVVLFGSEVVDQGRA
jgi:hypothetical protein